MKAIVLLVGLFLLTLSAMAVIARADCLQWICSKDRTSCMCVVTDRPPPDKVIPDRFNPWPPELDDRYGNPRRRD